MPQPFDIQTIYQFLTMLLGGTTFVGFFVAWKSRKAQVEITEGNALQEMQKAYRNFVADQSLIIQSIKADHQKEVDDLKKEVQSLRQEIEKQKNQCKHCKTKAT